MASTSTSSGGIGICGATFIVFLVLKLVGKIGWSWWWVTSPLWGPAAIVVGGILIFGVIYGVIVLIGALKRHRRRCGHR